MPTDTTRTYRHVGAALLRSAVAALGDAPRDWPDPDNQQACRSWLDDVWSRVELVDAIGLASPSLAHRVAAIRAGRTSTRKQLRRAVLATARYVLRATGRPTPFGLFAGVHRVDLMDATRVRWGVEHRPVARADTQWLADVVGRLEAMPDLRERLEVVVTDLAVRRGRSIEVPRGADRVRVALTGPVRVVLDEAASPVRFGTLADTLTAAFGATDRSGACAMLGALIDQGVLLTNLRAPHTVTDPLGHLVDRLRDMGAGALPAAAGILAELEGADVGIHRHNEETPAGIGSGVACRAKLVDAMRQTSRAGRSPLAVDVRLDCDVALPEQVVHELERAAGALLVLARNPNGSASWHDYHAAFCARYGTGTLVAVGDVVHPDDGLGYPAGYPGSMLPNPSELPLGRDQRLLELAWRAIHDRADEVVLTDRLLQHIAGGSPTARTSIPAHVEMAARLHAASVQDVDRGDFRLRVTPARSGGVLTSRFTTTMTGTGLDEVYRGLPGGVDGALPAQMSFGAAYPHAENIVRVPAYLPHVLPVGEHRKNDASRGIVGLDDLAITATADRLYLVSVSRRQVVEPQVFHALALDKQPPPLARFLAQLTRAFVHGWTAFDWGPHVDTLPYLPQVRYGRSVLTPQRWRLSVDDLPAGPAGQRWRDGLDVWRRRWGCPEVVDLRDDDRSLRLTLTEPLHAAILHTHLARYRAAILTPAVEQADFGWIDGHAHEIAVPLASTRPATPTPPIRSAPTVGNAHGWVPAAPGTRWLYARIHAHPDRHEELITDHLPALAARVGGADYWFVRYRSPRQTDHLRLRLRLPDGPDGYGQYAAVLGAWSDRLRRDRLLSEVVLDTYVPEVGRYGDGATLAAAETVFVTDSRLVTAALRQPPDSAPVAWTVATMAGLVRGLLADGSVAWLTSRPAPASTLTGRALAEEATHQAAAMLVGDPAPGCWADAVQAAWQARAEALAAYRDALPADGMDGVLESLLHMHHNRALGIDPDREAACRRLIRQAAVAWRARHPGGR